MTNDFSVEQKRPSAAPYGIVGLAAGAGLGTQLPKWTSKPMSYEQIIEEVNDKDKFDKRIAEDAEHATEWKDVQAQAAKVKKAEEELAEASKPGLPATSTEARELAEAKEKLQKEIDRLQAIENGKAGVTGVTGKFDPEKLPKFEELSRGELPATYVEDVTEGWGIFKKTLHKQGDNIDPVNDREYYESLSNDLKGKYQRVKNKLDSSTFDLNTGEGALKKQNDILDSIKTEIDRICRLDEAGRNAYFTNDHYDKDGNLVKSNATTKAESIVNSNKRTINSLTDDEVRSIGQSYEKLPTYDTVNQSYRSIKQQVTDATTGRTSVKTEYIVYNNQQYGELLQQRKNELVEKQKQMVDEIRILLQDASDKKKELDDLANTFGSSVHNEYAQPTGLLDKDGKLDLKKIIDKGDKVTAYDGDINSIKEMLEKGTWTDASNEHILNEYIPKSGSSYAKSEAEAALGYAEARKEVLKQYLERQDELKQVYNESVRATELVRQYDPMIEKCISSDAEYAKSLETFKKAYPTRCENASVTSSSARTITESDVAESFRNTVKDKQKIYDDAVAKNGGKIDEALKATKEKLVTEEKEKLTKMSEELSGKVAKVPGMKKGWGMAIGAVALGLVGLGIGRSVNKNKNA